MRRITLDAEGKLRLPPELCRRYQLDRDEELLLGKTETGLVLHTLRPDVRKVYLEVTTRCNLRCHTCVRNVWSESPEDMTNATFDHVVTGMQDLPDVREVVFGGYGEPFAHPRILDYLAAIKALGLNATISTNGTLLGQEQAERLALLGVDNVVKSLRIDPANWSHYRTSTAMRTSTHG